MNQGDDVQTPPEHAIDVDSVEARVERVVETMLWESQRDIDRLRNDLAAEVVARKSDRAAARESMDRAQDLGAELFRIRAQLGLARMEADENCSRVLDIEAQVRELEAQRGTVMAELAEQHLQYARLSGQLSQELAQHQHDATRWQAELDRARQAH